MAEMGCVTVLCPVCRGTGYVTETVSVVHDGGYLPNYIVMACDCNPAPTDEDWLNDQSPCPPFDVPGVDYDRRINDARYAGV